MSFDEVEEDWKRSDSSLPGNTWSHSAGWWQDAPHRCGIRTGGDRSGIVPGTTLALDGTRRAEAEALDEEEGRRCPGWGQGSSSRGGPAALRGLVRRLTGGTTVSVLVDGPRGPARVAKTGIVALADRTGTPIQPVAFSARPSIRLKSWDRSLVPLPFARVVCAFGKGIAVASAGDDEREQELARRLDEELAELHRAADRAVEAR